jgi:hypothetical protein
MFAIFIQEPVAERPAIEKQVLHVRVLALGISHPEGECKKQTRAPVSAQGKI